MKRLDALAPGERRRCSLCRCDAVARLYGFVVCSYHVDHGEDSPPCPGCDPDVRRLRAEARSVQIVAEQLASRGVTSRAAIDSVLYAIVTRASDETFAIVLESVGVPGAQVANCARDLRAAMLCQETR